ncbi:hypothetical protein BJ742DRAFT_352893 [Cladochytrium replicatum]|nr:hypothetical protein BJ742DRAFT_352893 [Cladochytrium replicatum]
MALSKIHVVCQVHGEGDRAKISRDADQDVVVIHPAPPSFRDEQRLRFDLCFGDGATPDDVFFETEMHILADAVSLGYNAGLFVTGIGRGDFQNRSTHYFTKIVDILKEYHDDLENPSISFCQIGVPSSRVIDLVNEKVLPGDAKHLEEEWVNLLKPISDYDEISNVLSKGCSIPNIVAIRIETKGRTSGTVGTLFLVDLGLPVVTSILNQPRPASKSHSQCGGACVDPSLSFSGSFSGIAKLVSFLTTSHYEGAIPVAQDPFTAICSELFGGNGITKVVVHLDALAEDVSTVSAALRLSSSMRRVRNRPVVNHTDPRLFELATRCEGVENERDLLQV